METSQNKVIMSVVALLAGGLLGGLIGYAMGMNMEKKETTNTSNNSAMSNTSDGVMVGGAKMVRDKDIVDNAVNADNVKTTVSLVQMAGLVDTLKGEGPFTVFAPNDGAFAKIDKATVESLQKPENVEMLKKILTYHVVPGTYTAADLRAMASKGEMLTSVQGQKLSVMVTDNQVMLKDAKGSMISIETADVISSNGVTHVITSVMMPN